MPRVRIYDDNVVPLARTTDARFQAPDMRGGFGAAIGAGAQEVGGALSDRADALAETHKHEEAAASGLMMQKHLQSVDQFEQDWQQGKVEGAPASGAGMQASVLKQYDEGVKAIVDQVQDRDVRERLELQSGEYRRNYASRTFKAESDRLADYFTDQNKQTTVLAANRMRASNDPADVTATLADLSDIIKSYNVPDGAKGRLTQWTSAQVQGAFLDGQIERSPARALELIDKGFGADLPPAAVDQYRDEARAAIRAQEAQARAEQAHQVSVQKDQLGAVEQGLNDGGGTVQDRAAVAQRYSALGDESKAAYWRQQAVEFAAVQGSKDWTLPDMDRRITDLTAKQGGKDGLTGPEAAELKGLQGQRSQSATRLNQTGGALLQLQYATGRPVQPIDIRNPASLRNRANDAVAAAQRYGRATVEPLLPEEVKPLQDLLAKGDVASRTQALNIITGFGSPAAVSGAARQITGEGDGAFRVAVTRSLGRGQGVAMNILGGADALKANPGLWQAPNPNDNTKLISAEAQARQQFQEFIPAMSGLGPDAANDTYEAAKAYYASKMIAAGKTQFDGEAWRQSIETVIGGYYSSHGWRGGTALFNGNQRVVIPEGWTGEGLFRRLNRATAHDWANAAGGNFPVWPDGSTVHTPQMRELVPVWVGGTSYIFRSPKTGNFLGTPSGQPFRIDAAKVPWR